MIERWEERKEEKLEKERRFEERRVQSEEGKVGG